MLRFLVFLVLSVGPLGVSAVSDHCRPVVAVYPLWKHSEEAMRELPWDALTHLAIFGVYPEMDGSLINLKADGYIPVIVEKAKKMGKQVFVSIGGAGDASKAFREIAKSQALTQKFVNNVVRYVEVYRLDGVDIDWEYWTLQNEKGQGGQDPVESQYLVQLLAKVRRALPPSAILTADIVAGPWLGEQYLPEIEKYVDYVNLMAFDFTGQWKGSPVSHHSDFSTFLKAIEYSVSRGFSKEKILVGLPAYGKEFVNGRNKEVKNIDYRKIVSLLHHDASKIKKGKFDNIYFETKKIVEKKARFVDKSGLGGVFLFEVTADSSEPNLSLLRTASSAVNPSVCYQFTES